MKIEIKNLDIKYRSQTILTNFSCTINSPYFTIIKGNSGSGKSSLLSSIYGINNIKDNNIFIDNFDINKLSFKDKINLKSKKITLLSKEFSLIEDLSLFDNLSLFNISKNEFFARLNEYKFNFQVNNFNEKGKLLSNGERNIFSLILSFIKNYDIYLIDETHSSLDTYNKEIFYQILKELKKEKIILLATQDDSFKDLADEIIDL